MHGGYISITHSHLGTGIFAIVGTSSALAVDTVPQRPGDQPGAEFWVNYSGTTEHMTKNRAGLEDYASAPVGDIVECAGGSFRPVVA